MKIRGIFFWGLQAIFFRKKRTASPKREKVYLFLFSRKNGSIFSFSRGTFYATLMMYKTLKIEPGLGHHPPTLRINLFDFVVNFIFYRY